MLVCLRFGRSGKKKYVLPVERKYPNGARVMMMCPEDKYNQAVQLQETMKLNSLDEAFEKMVQAE